MCGVSAARSRNGIAPFDGIGARAAARGVERAFVAHEHRAGDEELGHVDVDRRRRGAERRRPRDS